MFERDLEAACRSWAEARGWRCYKLTSPGTRGFPDRLFVRDGRIVFVEFKTKTGRVSHHQKRRIAELEADGCEVAVVRSLDEFVELMGG